MNGTDIISALLKEEGRQNIQGMAEFLSENVVYEMPYALHGTPEVIKGRDSLIGLLQQFIGKETGLYAEWSIHDVKIYPSGEPDLLFAEMMAKGIVSGSGYAYKQSYISLFRLHEDRVTMWREYFNPIPLQEALQTISSSDS